MARKAAIKKPNGQRATLVQTRPLAGGSVWELNVFTPKVGGQRSNIKVNGYGTSPLPEADRCLAVDGLIVAWSTTSSGAFVGEVSQ
jgi:hypothetical protein